MMWMDDNTKVVALGGMITVCVVTSLLCGIDGTVLASGIGAIGALAGFSVKSVLDARKK